MKTLKEKDNTVNLIKISEERSIAIYSLTDEQIVFRNLGKNFEEAILVESNCKIDEGAGRVTVLLPTGTTSFYFNLQDMNPYVGMYNNLKENLN